MKKAKVIKQYNGQEIIGMKQRISAALSLTTIDDPNLFTDQKFHNGWNACRQQILDNFGEGK